MHMISLIWILSKCRHVKPSHQHLFFNYFTLLSRSATILEAPLGSDVRWSDSLTGRAHQVTSSLISEPDELQGETVRTSGGKDLIEQCVRWSLIPAAAKSSQ